MTQCCHGCGLQVSSRNALFRHLKDTQGACLPKESLDDFQQYLLNSNKERQKVVLLYGYTILPNSTSIVKNGQDAALQLLQTLEELHNLNNNTTTNTSSSSSTAAPQAEASKINRSYGCNARSEDNLRQDEGTGAVTEVLAARLPPLLGTLEDWLHQINTRLDQKEGLDIRVFGRLDMSFSKFNAEMDVTHRRIEYLLPADFLLSPANNNNCSSRTDFFQSLPSFVDGCIVDIEDQHQHHDDSNNKNTIMPRLEAMNQEHKKPAPQTLDYLYTLKKKMQSLTTHIVELDEQDEAAVLEKNFHKQKRKNQRCKTEQNRKQHKNNTTTSIPKDNKTNNENKQQNNDNSNHDTGKSIMSPASSTSSKANISNVKNSAKKKNSKKGTHILQRKRFHNFTPKVLAHDFFAYRRMDRMFHKATLRLPNEIYDDLEERNESNKHEAVKLDRTRPFLAVNLTGDLFLHGQVCRVLGLFCALARGLINDEFVDCVFDEDYPHLVPTPPAPTFAMYAIDAFYMSWEGKCQKILTPRQCKFSAMGGWHDLDTRHKVQEYQSLMREEIAKVWLAEGVDSDGRLLAEKRWTEEVLEPWALRAREQLEHYRQWKKNLSSTAPSQENGVIPPETSVILPPLDSIDAHVPALYQQVLKCLRDADKCGLWPSTTTKRLMVMVSTPCREEGTDNSVSAKSSVFSSLSEAHMKAKKNKDERSSAYKFKEGEGGASGSFSVGAMPGDKGCQQPKGNSLFPELTKAAFELERALRPDREPSSTIAINRNAQFRPHTDSGAGAGQSKSLIVALGDFVGGELMVEGEKVDIRYNAIEFNGWTQRHWTMPFQGERYSLVWFTPKGCEGVHGIDLCSA